MSKLAPRLFGKTAIICGSTLGIGYSIAKEFVTQGAKIMICSRKQKNVDKALDNLKLIAEENGFPRSNIHGITCHVKKKEDRIGLVEETLGAFGTFNTLVHNVAVNPHFGPISEIKEDVFDKIFETNLKTPVMFTIEALSYLKKSSNASILFISTAAAMVHIEGITAYAMSKAAINRLVMSLSYELGPYNIRVNGLAPGIIDTKFGDVLTGNEKSLKSVITYSQLGRVGKADEMGGPAAFLCSDEASYITGHILVARG